MVARSNNSSSNSQPNQNPNNPNIQYLPSEEEAQQKINQIKTSKNLDDQQATIEFLTSYVPHIKWWEINSLQELDEKIKLVNNKTGFSPFKEVPKVDEFNERAEQNFTYKSLLFIASIIPRENDGSINWKGLDYHSYIIQVLKPLEKEWKFKPSFATQENFNELGRRIRQEINSSLISLCSQWTGLTKVSELNNLTHTYLSKIFVGYVYSEIQDNLTGQLGISGHEKFRIQKTGNHSINLGWKIALYEFAFKGGSEPNPDPSNNEYQLLEKDLQFIRDKFNSIKNRKEQEDPDLKWLKKLPFNSWICFEQDQVNGLPEIERLQTDLPNYSTDKSWITQTLTNIRKRHDWLFKNFQNKEEATDFLKNNEHRFKYVNKVWQNK